MSLGHNVSIDPAHLEHEQDLASYDQLALRLQHSCNAVEAQIDAAVRAIETLDYHLGAEKENNRQ